MARAPKQTKQEPLEVVLWKTADKLRKNIDAAEYKHVVLPKVYARQNLDPTSLGELIDLIGNIALGDAKSRSADVLGHVTESTKTRLVA